MIPLEKRYAKLKIDVLCRGIRLEAHSRSQLRSKPALRVRSGSCGGLDVIFSDGSYVNAPVDETFVDKSPIHLNLTEHGGTHASLERSNVDEEEIPVRLVPAPDYYFSDAGPSHLVRVGQICSDRLGIGLTNDCYYWRASDRRCRFCSIGLNVKQEDRDKTTDDVLAVVDAAFSDERWPARHILLGGGTPDGPDSGAEAFAHIARLIRRRRKDSIYVMVAPPQDLGYLELLRDAGVDELGMNIEIYDQSAAAGLMPGKHAEIGLPKFLEALERAVELFGPINTRSIMIAGLESPESTLEGVRELAARGVMPILSPFRPMVGTSMAQDPPPDPVMMWDLAVAASEIAAEHDLPLGPTCIPCQANTLTVGPDPRYRFY